MGRGRMLKIIQIESQRHRAAQMTQKVVLEDCVCWGVVWWGRMTRAARCSFLCLRASFAYADRISVDEPGRTLRVIPHKLYSVEKTSRFLI
jgi:hypothetical protein